MPLTAPATLKGLLLSALVAGVAAGLLSACLQQFFLVPMIRQAEAVEQGSAGALHNGIDRALYTALFDCLGAFGFALLLAGAYAWRGRVSWRQGLVWGLAGYACFSLAPALGLPPELPGAEAAALATRQVWWIATALATATGIACTAFAPVRAVRLLGPVLIALPHFIGAPGLDATGQLPHPFTRSFVVGSLTVSLAMWLMLGVLTALLMNRTATPASFAGPASNAGM